MTDEQLSHIKYLYESMEGKMGDCIGCHIADICKQLADEYGVAFCNIPPDFWDDPQRYKFSYQVGKAYTDFKESVEDNIQVGYCKYCPLKTPCDTCDRNLCDLDV